MMVEAEATEDVIELVRGAQAPTEEVVAAGLDAAKPFIKQLVEAQVELAANVGRQAGPGVPDLPRLRDDVFAAVESAVRPTSPPR